MRTKEELIELIKNLSDAFGPSGFEDDVVALGKASVNDQVDVITDTIKNAYFTLKSNTSDKPVVWLDAHSDEVGYIIQAIQNNGTMDFLTLGTMTASDMPCTKVSIKNNDGELVEGIIASVPPHFKVNVQTPGVADVSDLIIDVGASSRDEVQDSFGVGIASPCVPDVTCTYDEKHDLFLGKAFDCRVGCAALVETMNELSDKDLNVDVVGTFCTQEEIGGRGCEAAVDVVDADLCICFEGCPADDTFMPEYKVQSALHKGPMLRHFDNTMVTHPGFQRFALNTAKKHQIDVQESVRRGGGTNAGIIHKTRSGVPCIVIGIPVRYAHTPHCYCTLKDVQDAINLALAIVESLDEKIIDSFKA